MVRQKSRKAVENLYGSSKFDTNKSQAINVPVSKTIRCERELGGYLIQSNTPFTTMNLPPGVALSATMPHSALPTSRRKTTGTARVTTNRTNGPLGHHYAVDDIKKDLSSSKNKSMTIGRQEKGSAYSGASLCENKHFSTFGTHTHNHVQPPMKDIHQNSRTHSHSHSHHHHHHHQQQQQLQQKQQQTQRVVAGRDDEKDDDADEFFDVIKNTVENAVGKAISDLLNRNFRDLSAKIDRFSTELKTTNSLLNKLQNDINNKVVHYGEENSRHFRYLCMKSEYDKMFYQQQGNIVAGGDSLGKVNKNSSQCNLNGSVENQQEPCTCRPSNATNNKFKLEQTTTISHKVAPVEENMQMDLKTSSADMRDVIDHIQRFFTQMQMNGMMDRESHHVQTREPNYHNLNALDAMKAHKKVFEEVDDDDSQMSSDGMTPRSEMPYGANTMRSARHSSIVANMGDGDN